MDSDVPVDRYQELQRYVNWTDEDARRVRALGPVLEACFPALIDDFYAEIERHPQARKVITGGAAQVARLKGTLAAWVRDLFSGVYDRDYVMRRWRAGWRHVEIGLDQVYTNVALSRLRSGLLRALEERWPGDLRDSLAARCSLNTLLDLDLAIIEDAYQKERTEAAFRTLVEAAPSAIVIVRPDFRIAYFSPFAEELVGCKAANVLGTHFLQTFLPPEHQDSAAQELEKALAGIPTQGLPVPLLCANGSRRWMVWNHRRLEDYKGAPAILAVGQDVTELKEAQESALRSERLAAIGQMMTGLAHESGNALARSQACLEMLSWEVQDRPEAIRLIDRIQSAQDNLKQLYEEVRGYAAPVKLDCEPCDVSQIWRLAWEHIALLRQGRDATLREDTAGIDLVCPIDQFRLHQVFRNILENALAACPDPVRIDITCTAAEIEGLPALRVAVHDNGPGLTPEQSARIFEPFFTTKTKGTGLGMAIAKRIMEAHAGQIAVEPTSRAGATILLTLPREIL